MLVWLCFESAHFVEQSVKDHSFASQVRPSIEPLAVRGEVEAPSVVRRRTNIRDGRRHVRGWSFAARSEAKFEMMTYPVLTRRVGIGFAVRINHAHEVFTGGGPQLVVVATSRCQFLAPGCRILHDRLCEYTRVVSEFPHRLRWVEEVSQVESAAADDDRHSAACNDLLTRAMGRLRKVLDMPMLAD